MACDPYNWWYQPQYQPFQTYVSQPSLFQTWQQWYQPQQIIYNDYPTWYQPKTIDELVVEVKAPEYFFYDE